MSLPGSGVRPDTGASTCDESHLRARLVERIDTGDLDLPVLPDVASRVMSACQDQKRGPQELTELIQSDPALAGNVLRIANSVAYAAAEPIVSLQQAIARLGMSTLGDLAIAAAMDAKVFVVPGREDEMRTLRVHAATTGIWTREIARQRRRNVEAAFLSGLMHDAGKPILLRTVLELAGTATLAEKTLQTWVHEFHASVGAKLLARWKLPPWVAAAVEGHHAPEKAGEHRELAATVLLGDLLAHWSLGMTPEEEGAMRRNQVLATLCIYPDDLELILARKEVVRAAAESFA